MSERNPGLTVRQEQVADFIWAHWRSPGWAPTWRDIGNAFGMSSTNCVSGILGALARKGYVVRDAAKSRTTRLSAKFTPDDADVLRPGDPRFIEAKICMSCGAIHFCKSAMCDTCSKQHEQGGIANEHHERAPPNGSAEEAPEDKTQNSAACHGAMLQSKSSPALPAVGGAPTGRH